MATISDFLLRVQVTGAELVDKLKTSIEGANKSFDKGAESAGKFNDKTKQTGEAASKASDAIKGFGEKIMSASEGTTTFGGSVAGLLSKLGPFGMVAGAAVGTLGLMFTHAVRLADKIGDLSDATGISAGRLLSFKESILLAGGSAESFEKLISKLGVSLGEAERGNEKIRKTFRELGVDLGDANGKLRSTDDLLPEIIEALSKIENPATRAATAVELLGKSAAKIDWTKVSAGRDIFKDEEIAQLAKYQDAIDQLANTIQNKLITAFGRVAIAAKEGFGPAVAASIEQIGYALGKIPGLGIMEDLARKAEAARLGEKAGAGRGGQGGPTAAELATVTATAAGKTGQLAITPEGMKTIAEAKAITELLKQQDNIAASYAAKLNDTLGMQQYQGDILRATLNIERDRDLKLAEINAKIAKELADKERDSRVTGALVQQLREQGAEITKQAEKMKAAKVDELTKLQQQRNLMEDIALLNSVMVGDLQVKQLRGRNELIKYYGDELKLQQGILQISNEKENIVLAAENKLRALGKNATQEDINRTNSEIENAKRVADQKVEILRDEIEREKALREDAAEGAKRAMYDITQSMTPFKNAQTAVNNMFSSMSNAIDRFVETGKFNFGDLARSMIQDIIKVELKAQASKIFSGVFGEGGILGGIIGSIFGRAAGGPVNAGEPYIVGEKGPELFIPPNAGMIMPNNMLQNGGGAIQHTTQNINYNYNINAVDAKSVAQLFAENRKVLLGTIQMAQKELPYSNI